MCWFLQRKAKRKMIGRVRAREGRSANGVLASRVSGAMADRGATPYYYYFFFSRCFVVVQHSFFLFLFFSFNSIRNKQKARKRRAANRKKKSYHSSLFSMPAAQATPELSAAVAAQGVEPKPGAYPYYYYDTNNEDSVTAWARQRRRQRWIWRGIAALVTVIIAAVIAIVVVFVTRKQNKQPSYYHDVSPYANLTRTATLEPLSATSAGNRTAAQGRVFVVGDIHGCLDEFNALVSQLGYTSNDTLILAGDLIAKGPDSPGVLRRAMELGAKCVRGNHDDKVVRFRTYMNEHHTQELKDTLPEGNVPDPLRPNNYHASIAR